MPDCVEQTDEATFREFLRSGSSVLFSSADLLCMQPDETTCEKNYFGVCYPRHLHCVYEFTVGCRNAGHLKTCTHHSCPNQFKCPKAYCIPMHAVCNGRRDCPNGEDETDCRTFSCPGFLKCRRDDVCVHPHDLNSNHAICPKSQDDKAITRLLPCPLDCHCQGYAMLCEDIRYFSFPPIGVSFRLLIYRNLTSFGERFRWEVIASSRFLLHLEISSCGIDSEDLTHFRGLGFVKILKMTHNLITILDMHIFRSMNNLEVVDFRYNKVTTLEGDIFPETNVIKILRTDYNNIHTIGGASFARLRHLEVLTISNNDIVSLANTLFLFVNPRLLREVNISHNPIVNIDHASLINTFQNLWLLDFTPVKICCFLQSVPNCYPTTSVNPSACQQLFAYVWHRILIWMAGILIMLSTSVSILWIMVKHVSESKSLNNILALFLLCYDWLGGIYIIAIAVVDSVLSSYFAIYEAYWSNHLVCKMLKVLCPFCFMNSLLSTTLLSTHRMISVAFPFKVSSIQPLHFYVTSIISASFFFGAYAMRHAAVEATDESATRFCLGVVLPGTNEAFWRLGGFVFPGIVLYLIISICQLVIYRCINASIRTLQMPERVKRSRHNVGVKSCVYLLLTSLNFVPFLFIHLLSVSNVNIGIEFAVAQTLITLSLYPLINSLMCVYITPSFVRYVGNIFTLRESNTG